MKGKKFRFRTTLFLSEFQSLSKKILQLKSLWNAKGIDIITDVLEKRVRLAVKFSLTKVSTEKPLKYLQK